MVIREIEKKLSKEVKDRMKLEIESATNVYRLTDLIFTITELKSKGFLTEEDFKELKELHRKRMREVMGERV